MPVSQIERPMVPMLCWPMILIDKLCTFVNVRSNTRWLCVLRSSVCGLWFVCVLCAVCLVPCWCAVSEKSRDKS